MTGSCLVKCSSERHSNFRGELAAMFGIAEHDRARSWMRLMGALGGCGLRTDSVGLAADAAFWTS